MRPAISGIALLNGIALRGAGMTCTAKRESDGRISVKTKKHSKRMRQMQLIGLLVFFILSLLPDASNTPDAVITSVLLPIFVFILTIRMLPNLRLLNYHGAEHKVVVAYRNRIPLTLESVKPISRVTNLCGTMLIVPIILYVFLLSLIVTLTSNQLIHLVSTVLVCLLLIHYFFVRGEEATYVNLKHFLPFLKKKLYRLKSNKIYKLYDLIGYALQEHFTTKEPSDAEIEVAITCMQTFIK